MKRLGSGLLALLMVFVLGTCNKKDEQGCPLPSCLNVNLFSVSEDVNLGAQVAQQIANDAANYPVVPRAQAESSYRYLEAMRDRILNSGRVARRNEFQWPIYLIKDDNTLNAFCTPGGYIYVYTGLIRYLDREDDLAGVIGHEIAHADRRHSTAQMTRQYGLSTLLSVASGSADPGLIAQVAGNLIGLSYGRCDESEADAYSVTYLAGTGYYNCAATASFFQKLEDAGQGGSGPAFLSTHPSPSSRVADINSRADCIKCSRNLSASQAAWDEFKRNLP